MRCPANSQARLALRFGSAFKLHAPCITGAFVAFALFAVVPASAGTLASPADARAILIKGVGFDTVIGRGKVPAYAEYLKSMLVAGGFAASDISIEPVGETANLHLVWKDSGKAAPIAIAGHMDVVEADRRDWIRNPFIANRRRRFFVRAQRL